MSEGRNVSALFNGEFPVPGKVSLHVTGLKKKKKSLNEEMSAMTSWEITIIPPYNMHQRQNPWFYTKRSRTSVTINVVMNAKMISWR